MLQPPQFLFVDINQHCNLRCQHCFYWTRREVDLPGQLSVQRRSEIIAEFAALNAHGTVVICGGESLLNPERYFPITRQCRALGLTCYSVINGTRVTDGTIAAQMIEEGPSAITVSLNSHRPEVHDRTRGVQGSFALATAALRYLLSAREHLGAAVPIYAMAVICEQNYRELDAFYNFALNILRVDKLKLNFLQPTFGSPPSMKVDKFYRDNIVADDEELGRILEACNRKYNLQLNPEWVRVVLLYHHSVRANGDAARGWAGRGTSEPICNSYERNIMVNLTGEARLCFSTGFPGQLLVKPGDLARFWYGNQRLRRRMGQCRQTCGISHSVRRVSATLKLMSLGVSTWAAEPIPA